MATLVRSDIGRGSVVAVAAAAVYVVASETARIWVFDVEGIQPYWPATAAATAVALAAPVRLTAYAVAGAAVGEILNAGVFFGRGLADIAASTVANVVEIVVAVVLFRTVTDPEHGIVKVNQSLRWMVAAALAGLCGAAVATALVLGGDGRFEAGLRWWIGDFLGLVIVAPLGILRVQYPVAPVTRSHALELALVSLLLGVFTVLAFSTAGALTYLTLPFLVWLAVRFGFRVASPAAIVVTSWATIRTADGHGPFIVDPGDHVLRVQAYNLAIGSTVMVMSALATRAQRGRDALAVENAERQRLEAELASVRIDERQRIARRLHDDAIQVLVAADLQLAAARRRPDRDGPLEVATEQIRVAIDELRDTVNALSPPELDGHSLDAGLRVVADRFATGVDSPEFALATRPVDGLSRAVAHALYQIGREAIANAARHSGARHATVTLTDDGDAVTLTVEDDGIGLTDIDPVVGRSGHLGMRLMHERAAAVGATLRVSPRPGGGTVVAVTVPKRTLAPADRPAVPVQRAG